MRRYLALLTGAAAAAVCVSLGLWQMDRLRQRQELNASVREALDQPAVDLDPAIGGFEPYRRAVATGTFDLEREIVVEARSFQGGPAVVVVTPLTMSSGAAVLVERGWVPSPDGRTVPLQELREPGTVRVEGLLVSPSRPLPPPSESAPWPLHVRWADPGTLSPRYPYPLIPLVLRRANVPEAERRIALRPVPPPALDSGPHLAYAIQWFAFALIAAVGSVILFRRDKREQGMGNGERGTGKGE